MGGQMETTGRQMDGQTDTQAKIQIERRKTVKQTE
jgi:hypothetical protein